MSVWSGPYLTGFGLTQWWDLVNTEMKHQVPKEAGSPFIR